MGGASLLKGIEMIGTLQKLKEEGVRLYCFRPDFGATDAVWRTVFEQYTRRFCAADRVARRAHRGREQGQRGDTARIVRFGSG